MIIRLGTTIVDYSEDYSEYVVKVERPLAITAAHKTIENSDLIDGTLTIRRGKYEYRTKDDLEALEIACKLERHWRTTGSSFESPSQ
jgi:hypothetical protein